MRFARACTAGLITFFGSFAGAATATPATTAKIPSTASSLIARSSYGDGVGGEVLPQPALGLAGGDSFPRRVVRKLVGADATDREVPRLGMVEVDAADARRGQGRKRLGELEPLLLCAQQREQPRLLAVVGTGRIAEGRADAAVALGDPLVVRELLVRRVPLAAHLFVLPLGERLGEP